MIAPTRPGELIWSGKQGIDFRDEVRNWIKVRVKRLLGMASTRWICAEWAGASESRVSKKE